MPNWWKQASRSLDMLSKPVALFQELADNRDLRPGVAALAVTSLLFAVASVVSHRLGVPMAEPPVLPIPAYRLWQAVASPALLGLGWLAGALAALGLCRLLHGHADLRVILAVSAPALFVPLWMVFWPTEMALSLHVFTLESPGFSGLWVRKLAPAFTFIYILGSLCLAYWRALRLLLREAFVVAFGSALPALAWWAVVFR